MTVDPALWHDLPDPAGPADAWPDVPSERPVPPPPDPRAVRLRVALWRARPGAAVLGLVVLVLVAARLAAPPSPPTVPVVVTARDVAAGTPLDATALRVVRARPGTVPDGAAVAVDALVGREALIALPVGLPVVEGVLAGDRFAVAAPEGTVVVALRLADPAVTGLLRPGDRVDLVTAAATEGGTQAVAADVVAHGALVLDRTTVTDAPGAAGSWGLGGPADAGAVLTVVAVPPDDGRRLAAVAGWADLGAVLVG